MNSIFSSVVLGVLQGLTEFLPVSSSGHLVMAKTLIGNLPEQGVLFESVLHAGTACAVLFFFRKEILSLTKTQIILLGIGTVPIGIIGVLFQDSIESLFNVESLLYVGVALILTSFINFGIHALPGKNKNITIKNALVIGIFQAIAIVPGISRSGITIFAGKTQKIDSGHAARFSFILSLPAILGANVLQIYKYSGSFSVDSKVFISGFLSAFISGALAIKLVLKLLEVRKFWIFGVYCFIVGVLLITL